MTPNNNLSILPFYTSLDKQNHNKDYALGEVFPIYSPLKQILPFQILRADGLDSVEDAFLKGLNNGYSEDVTDDVLAIGISYVENSSEGYGIIKCAGGTLSGSSATEGLYYLELHTGDGAIYYSEIFMFVASVTNLLKIEYWSDESIEFDGGSVSYSSSFKHRLYLPTQLGKPEYAFEEDVENRDGFNFVEKQVSAKTYKFNFLAPEFLLDAMRIIRMSDHIEVTNRGEQYDVDSFLITPTWEDGGWIASVEAEFQCNTVVKKIGARFGDS